MDRITIVAERLDGTTSSIEAAPDWPMVSMATLIRARTFLVDDAQ